MHVQDRLFTAAPHLRGLDRIERTELDATSWVDVRRGWLEGDDQVFDALEASTTWHAGRRPMYDRIVDVPRLTAVIPRDGPGHAVLDTAVVRLSEHYGRAVDRVSLALYRTGRDSVAFHGDRLGDAAVDAIVAILSLRGPRRLRMRPRVGRATRSWAWDLGFGDLVVMGGRAQADFVHGVPKVASAPPRMSVMFRSSGVVPRPAG